MKLRAVLGFQIFVGIVGSLFCYVLIFQLGRALCDHCNDERSWYFLVPGLLFSVLALSSAFRLVRPRSYFLKINAGAWFLLFGLILWFTVVAWMGSGALSLGNIAYGFVSVLLGTLILSGWLSYFNWSASRQSLELRTLTPQDEKAFFDGMKEWSRDDLSWYTFAWKEGMSYPQMLEILRKETAGIDLAPGESASYDALRIRRRRDHRTGQCSA